MAKTDLREAVYRIIDYVVADASGKKDWITVEDYKVYINMRVDKILALTQKPCPKCGYKEADNGRD